MHVRKFVLFAEEAAFLQRTVPVHSVRVVLTVIRSNAALCSFCIIFLWTWKSTVVQLRCY